jgi:hypothetical protein
MFDGFVKEELHGCDTKCWLLFEMLIRYNLFYTKNLVGSRWGIFTEFGGFVEEGLPGCDTK